MASTTLAGDPEQPEGRDSQHEPGTVALRPVLLAAILLVVAAVAFLTYSCIRSPASGSAFSSDLNRFQTGTVTYLDAARTYLVRREDGSFLALSEVEAGADDRVRGCVIRYRADLSAAGQSGVFRDDCNGTIFGRDGIAIQGSAAPMQQHPVQVADGKVIVRVKMCLSGSGTSEPCRE